MTKRSIVETIKRVVLESSSDLERLIRGNKPMSGGAHPIGIPHVSTKMHHAVYDALYRYGFKYTGSGTHENNSELHVHDFHASDNKTGDDHYVTVYDPDKKFQAKRRQEGEPDYSDHVGVEHIGSDGPFYIPAQHGNINRDLDDHFKQHGPNQ